MLGEAQGGNVNYFACLTSGFHSVNESFLLQQCLAVMSEEIIPLSQSHGNDYITIIIINRVVAYRL